MIEYESRLTIAKSRRCGYYCCDLCHRYRYPARRPHETNHPGHCGACRACLIQPGGRRKAIPGTDTRGRVPRGARQDRRTRPQLHARRLDRRGAGKGIREGHPLRLPGQMGGALLLPSGLHLCLPHRDQGVQRRPPGIQETESRDPGRLGRQQVLPPGLAEERYSRRPQVPAPLRHQERGGPQVRHSR